MPNKKTLIYALIVFVLSFAISFTLIKHFKKSKKQEELEKVQD